MKKDKEATKKHREGMPAIEVILQRIENNSRLQTEKQMTGSPRHASLASSFD